MRVFTPDEVATGTESKYLGVLVAAKYSRELNTLPSEAIPLGEEKKLTNCSDVKTLWSFILYTVYLMSFFKLNV